jgi:RNA polymerase sigma-70 factor, ECF subfamily
MPMTVTAQIPDGTRDDSRDLELLRGVAARDERALEQLYRLYHRPLRQFLARLQRGGDSVEEAINDTFWVVWCQASQFRGASRVSTWITGIAWRCALSALRRNSSGITRQADPRFLHGDGESVVADPQGSDERNEWLARGLASLPFEQRATLQLAYFLGHSCAEIAQIMQCPVNTVKARMFQARIKLRNVLPGLGGAAVEASGGIDGDAASGGG